jgi:hypothetical protein
MVPPVVLGCFGLLDEAMRRLAPGWQLDSYAKWQHPTSLAAQRRSEWAALCAARPGSGVTWKQHAMT